MITPLEITGNRSQIYAAYNRRLDELIEAQREIARLQQRVINLQRENQALSYRLIGAESGLKNEK